MPAGLTGLWQTSARAQSTFGEALDMDVLYAQSWSLSLDLLLLALFAGRERDEAQWRALLGTAGFEPVRIDENLIEAEPRA